MNKSVALVVSVLALATFSSACRRAAAPPPASPSGGAAAAAPASAPPALPPPPAYSGPVVEVPAGSRLVLRMDDTVDSARGAGLRFRATLEAALLDATGKPIVPLGTKVLGIVAS